MRWGVFAVAAFAALVLDVGLGGALRVDALNGTVRPSVLVVLATFVALWAPRWSALWGCFVLGLLLDTASPVGPLTLLGPHALGFSFAAALLLQLRSMVLRKQPVAVAVLTAVYAGAAAVVVVAILAIRIWWYPHEGLAYAPAADLLRRLLSAAYSGLLALPVGWLLLRTMGAWGFQHPTHARFARR